MECQECQQLVQGCPKAGNAEMPDDGVSGIFHHTIMKLGLGLGDQ